MQPSTPTREVSRDHRILVVDDDRIVASYLRRLLSAEGFDCDVAHDLAGAWECLESSEYSLLVTDIRMPDGSGLDLLARTRERFGDQVAVIVVTGVDEKDVGIRSVHLGAYSYLIKPFDGNEAVIHVVNAFKRRRLAVRESRFQEELRTQVREAQEEIGWRLLCAVGWRDIETGAHIRRVGRAAHALASRLDWDPERLGSLELAAAMHDVGKIAVPDAVLLKTGPLTDAEYRLIQQHTVAGAAIMRGSASPLLRLAEQIARSHHERWDGDGYPDGLSGSAIPEPARIVAVADVFDALTSDRPYRDAYREDEALGIMIRGRELHFDPEILDLFVDILPGLGFRDLPDHPTLPELGELERSTLRSA